MSKSRVDKAIEKDILKSFFTLLLIVLSLTFAIFGGIQLGNDISYQVKYRDYVNELILSGYEVYLNGTLVDSDKISIYTYPNKSIAYDADLQRVYIGCTGVIT